MEKIRKHYEDERLRNEALGSKQARRAHLLGTAKLILIALAGIVVYVFRAADGTTLAAMAVLLVAGFGILMRLQTAALWKANYFDIAKTLCEQELEGLRLNHSAFDGGKEYASPSHPFTSDLDVFGERSLFQTANRTVTPMGIERLATWFRQPLTSKAQILERQHAVQELSLLAAFRQHFAVQLRLDAKKGNRLPLASQAEETAHPLSQSYMVRLALWLVPSGWVALAVLFSLDMVPSSALGVYLAVSFLVAYSKTKAVNRLYNAFNKTDGMLKAYALVIGDLEKKAFTSELLRKTQQTFLRTAAPASQSIRQLSRIIGALDQRLSLMGVLFNLFVLWDIRQALRLERWQQENGLSLAKWFDALGQFDALCSLGTFAFNHPNYTYATPTDGYFHMNGRDLGHPLIAEDRCVRNDIAIAQAPFFLIITGANMAGKSTYLRTIGVNFLLSSIGCPAFASSLSFTPAPLVTSLCTSDSLVSNESYFFAELKSLQSIILRLKQGEKLFIIMDEILKGTNSVDKQKGSLALMKQLVGQGACGIIATHDLILGGLEKEFPQQIKNFRFEADIQNDELSFSYRLREGIAQNMNACFLMKKMGIYIE